MNLTPYLINVLAYAVFYLGSLVVWPSRKNFIAWMSLPVFVIAYLIPLSFFDYSFAFDADAINRLAAINGVGAFFMLLGILLGRIVKFRSFERISFDLSWNSLNHELIISRIYVLMIFSVLVMFFCFMWMGQFPMFAADPYDAKFFKGPYKEKYDQVAFFFRLSQSILATVAPIACAYIFLPIGRRLILPVLLAVVIFSLALTRSEAGTGLALLLVAWGFKSRGRFFVSQVVLLLLYGFGNVIYSLLGLGGGVEKEAFQTIVESASDIADQLSFLSAFDPETQLTYGATVFGGVVPGNFYYNPSVFFLAVANGTDDISGLASGGYRMPITGHGYAAFGFFGVCVFSFVSGFFVSLTVKILRKINFDSIVHIFLVILWYKTICTFFVDFYWLTYGKFIALTVFLFIVHAATSRDASIGK